MRALLALAVLAAPLAAALVEPPVLDDTNGDLVPDTVHWHPEPVAACGPGTCAGAAFDYDALPDDDGYPMPTEHEGAAFADAGDCAAACARAALATSYQQDQARHPDITLHDFPDFGADGGASLQAAGARLDAPVSVTDTDRNNNTHAGAAAPHAAGPVAGTAGFESAVLVLLHHDRGLPHTRVAYAAPFARECLDATCADAALNHTYFHHDADDDVIHEQQRVGADDAATLPSGRAAGGYEAGFLLEDSFFIVEPPSGASGDGAAAAEAAPPLLPVPPAQAEGSFAFAVRDPDRDHVPDEAFAEACVLGSCTRLG